MRFPLLLLASALALTSCVGGSDGQNTTMPPREPTVVPKLVGPFAVDETADRLYWAVSRAIWTSELGGSDKRPFMSDLRRTPRYMAVNHEADRLVWSDGDQIYSVALDATGLRPLTAGTAFALLPGEDAMFFLAKEDTQQVLYRMALPDGTPERIHSTQAPVPDLAADHTMLYWTEDEQLMRMSLEGSAAERVPGEFTWGPGQLALGSGGKYLYRRAGRDIHRLDLDATGTVTILGGDNYPDHIYPGSETTLYWSHEDTQRIWSVAFRREAEVVLETNDRIATTALDGKRGQLYWSSGTAIHRAPVDGTDRETILRTIPDFAQRVRIDATHRELYIRTKKQILRAGLDGSALEILRADVPTGSTHAGGLEVPDDIAVDPDNGKMYWQQSGDAGQTLMRANLDGSDAEELIAGVTAQTSLDVDASAGRLYFQDERGVWGANLDGSDAHAIAFGWPEPRPLARIVGIRVDARSRKLYVLDFDALYRANLDGTEPELLVDMAGLKAHSLALDGDSGLVYFRLHGRPYVLDTNAPDSVAQEVPCCTAGLASTFSVHSGTLYGSMRAGHIARFPRNSPDDHDILVAKSTGITALAVHPVEAKLYWLDPRNRTIFGSDLEGGSIQVVRARRGCVGLGCPDPLDDVLSMDPAGSRLYYSGDDGVSWIDPSDLSNGVAMAGTRAASLAIAADSSIYLLPPSFQRSISKWDGEDLARLIKLGDWPAGSPASIVLDDASDRLYVLGDRGMLFGLSSNGAESSPIALLNEARGSSPYPSHYHAPTQSFYFARDHSIFRFDLGSEPLLQMVYP
ncbi:MAG: hypothetical protein OXR73_20640 [Myxococcales bacterium]|nr:hypothetical protein [Myxococcales bacterium]